MCCKQIFGWGKTNFAKRKLNMAKFDIWQISCCIFWSCCWICFICSSCFVSILYSFVHANNWNISGGKHANFNFNLQPNKGSTQQDNSGEEHILTGQTEIIWTVVIRSDLFQALHPYHPLYGGLISFHLISFPQVCFVFRLLANFAYFYNFSSALNLVNNMQMIRPESNWKRKSAVCEVCEGRLQLFF